MKFKIGDYVESTITGHRSRIAKWDGLPGWCVTEDGYTRQLSRLKKITEGEWRMRKAKLETVKLKREVNREPLEGDVMRVKINGALVRLVMPEDGDDELIDAQGYVYVEPVEEIGSWYHISELEPK